MRQGGLRDAILHSVGANATHGLRKTNADKRRAVGILLEDELVSIDPETGNPWSNREIARRCAVDEWLVRKLRAPSAGAPQMDEPRTVSRGGKVYLMETGRIGRQQPEPDPPAPESAPAPDTSEQGPGQRRGAWLAAQSVRTAMSEKALASANVPAIRDAIKTMGEASGTQRRRFP